MSMTYTRSPSTKIPAAARVVVALLLAGALFFGCDNGNKAAHASGFGEPLAQSQVITLSLESEYMDTQVPCLVYLPKGYGGGHKYPVWYGLHGHGSSQTMWVDNGVAEAADELIDSGEIEPIIMVFPRARDATLKEIEQDIAEDGKLGEASMDQFLCKELVVYIDAHYDTDASASRRYIGGFSMGGMIALRIAFRHTELFGKVGGYSAAVISSDYSGRQLEQWLYPYDNVEELDDIIRFDKEKGFDKLQVYLDAGNENDPFSTGLQSLYDALQYRGISSEFRLCEGGHTLQKESIKDYLKFYAKKNIDEKKPTT